MGDAILDVDLLAFERGTAEEARAVIDGVMRSLATGFVYTTHDIPEDILDEAYEKLTAFFALPSGTKQRWVADGAHGQTGYTGLLVETAASSDHPDWKEMLNWSAELPAGHPLRRRFPHRYADQVLPEADVPGITEVLMAMHRRLEDLQSRFLRIIAVGLGCHVGFFDSMLGEGATLTRAIHYPPMATAPAEQHVWAAEHGDINLITALPRASTGGLQVSTDRGWIDAEPPPGHAIINTGIMLDRLSNGRIPVGVHRVVGSEGSTRDRYSVVQFLHPTPWTILAPVAPSITPDRPQRYAPIEAGDLLDQVLFDINLVENARRVST